MPRILAVLLVLVSGAVVPAQAQSFPKGPPRDPNFFPLAVWLQSPANASKYRAIGINTYVALWKGPTEEQLDRLETVGMKVVCRQSLAFRDRASIIAWMHEDEPDNAQSLGRGKGYGPPVLPSKIVEDYEKLRQADPDRPIFLNLGQGVAYDQYIGRGVRTNHPEDYREYLKGCDIGSFDIYPASHDKKQVAGNLWYVAEGVARLRRWSDEKKPIWCCIETTGINNAKVRPTPRQVKSEVWLALIHGANGIIYFAHQFQPKFVEAGLLADPAMAESVGETNRQIQSLAPVLNSPNVTGVVQVSSDDSQVPVAHLVKRQGDVVYVFAVASRPGKTVGTFRLTSAIDATVEVLGESRTLSASGGTWTDPFEDYGVHLYRVVPKVAR